MQENNNYCYILNCIISFLFFFYIIANSFCSFIHILEKNYIAIYMVYSFINNNDLLCVYVLAILNAIKKYKFFRLN
jgi:hypothetical protein